MKHVLSVVAAFLFMTTTVLADEVATTPPSQVGSATEDCSQQVWANFSPSCLRNADRAISVRLVTTTRR
jgi:hypothetical protein